MSSLQEHTKTVLCNEDTKMCYRARSESLDEEGDREDKMMLGCMPARSPEESYDCEHIKRLMKEHHRHATMKQFFCMTCTSNECNRPTFLQVTLTYRNSLDGVFLQVERLLWLMTIPVRLVQMDPGVFDEIVKLWNGDAPWTNSYHV